jgi:hypothetical protein
MKGNPHETAPESASSQRPVGPESLPDWPEVFPDEPYMPTRLHRIFNVTMSLMLMPVPLVVFSLFTNPQAGGDLVVFYTGLLFFGAFIAWPTWLLFGVIANALLHARNPMFHPLVYLRVCGLTGLWMTSNVGLGSFLYQDSPRMGNVLLFACGAFPALVYSLWIWTRWTPEPDRT